MIIEILKLAYYFVWALFVLIRYMFMNIFKFFLIFLFLFLLYVLFILMELLKRIILR